MISVVEYNEDLKYLSSSFSCGNKNIDNFLKGSDSLESDICKTYIMINIDSKRDGDINPKEIIGFFSLAADAVIEPPEYNEYNKIVFKGSAIRIYMFAVNEKYQQKRVKISSSESKELITKTYASLLLFSCFDYIDDIVNNHIGAMYVILSATEKGVGLYQNVGGFEFLETEDEVLSYIEGDGACKSMYKFIKNDEY